MNDEITWVGHSWNAESLAGREIDKKAQTRTVVHQHLSSVIVPMTAPVEGSVVLDDAVEIAVVVPTSRVCGFDGSAGGTVRLPNLIAVWVHADLKVNLIVEHEECTWVRRRGPCTDVLDHACTSGGSVGLPELCTGAVG